MNTGRPVCSQLAEWIHSQQFQRCVTRYRGEHKVQSFSCWDQFLCMGFGQLTYRESLRDTVDCLCARPDLLYHMGFRGAIRRSTLADANESRDWRICATLAQQLIRRARRLYEGEPLTNHFALPAQTIALLYKSRWQVELFFKWIKQHLRIKSFFGTSAHAVMTQVWIAICIHVLVVILKKRLDLPRSLHKILQILSVNAFEKVPLRELLMQTTPQFQDADNRNQLMLLEL